MPIINGAYVSPNWINNSPPALDATELNAMSDTIVDNQRKIGDIILTTRTNLGNKYLLCNGAELTSSAYPDLKSTLQYNSVVNGDYIMQDCKISDPTGYTSYVGLKYESSPISLLNGYFVFVTFGKYKKKSSGVDGWFSFIYYSINSALWSSALLQEHVKSGERDVYEAYFQKGVIYAGGRYAFSIIVRYGTPSSYISYSYVNSCTAVNAEGYMSYVHPNFGQPISNLNYNGSVFFFVSRSENGKYYYTYTSPSSVPTNFSIGATIYDSGVASTVVTYIGFYSNRYYFHAIDNISSGIFNRVFVSSSITMGSFTLVTFDNTIKDSARCVILSGYIYWFICVSGDYAPYSSTVSIVRTTMTSYNVGKSVVVAQYEGASSSLCVSANSSYAICDIAYRRGGSDGGTLNIEASTGKITTSSVSTLYGGSTTSIGLTDDNVVLNTKIGAYTIYGGEIRYSPYVIFYKKFNAKYLPSVDGNGQYPMIKALN